MSTPPPTTQPRNFWTRDRVVAALEAVTVGNPPTGPQPFRRVWTDTRTIEPGDLFVALAGERFDAHDFLKDAVLKGASGLVVSRAAPAAGLGAPVFEVSDTLVALGALGRYRRKAWSGPVVAVVGTNGKTSTKELIRAALGSRLDVHATTGNLNNLVGVPLTLLAIPDSADVAVIEMGTNAPGEIARLRAIVDPDVTVVTSIAEEHLEGLGDVAGVLREELAGVEQVPVAVVPASQPEVADGARGKARRVVTAGLDGGDVSALGSSIDENGRGHMRVDGCEIVVPLRGVHNLRNATLALAVARELGVTLDDAARGIAAMAPPPMRVNWERLGRATLINDAYNSNPGSARAALELLQHAGEGRQRVAVLGTMLELGIQADRLHDEIARAALESPIELVIGVGGFADALARVAPGHARAVGGADPESAWHAARSRLDPTAVILLKGSRGVRLERLVPLISEWTSSST
jgi:UDP-N-acetylmuramoyl-tripeptide--D-alanyl-D-alanine ligase